MGTILKGLRTDAMVARIFIVVLLALSCGGDAKEAPDGGGADAALVDAGADAGAEFPRPGFGEISGDCDVLDDELASAEPALFRTAIDFERLYIDADEAMLSAGAQQIIEDGNAGGSSLLSEVFAFEVLARCELANLLKTETQIVYDEQGSITDFLAEIDELKLGVSVTRAVGFPFDDPYLPAQGTELLVDKLAGIIESSSNVSDADRWQKQVLAILAYAPGHADVIADAWASLDANTRADTLVMIIVTNGADDFIYCDGTCP